MNEEKLIEINIQEKVENNIEEKEENNEEKINEDEIYHLKIFGKYIKIPFNR